MGASARDRVIGARHHRRRERTLDPHTEQGARPEMPIWCGHSRAGLGYTLQP
jgi:hypothetical protein